MAIAGPKRVLIDNHLGPYGPHTLSQVDPAAQMAALRDIGTDAVLLQAKCHWGHAYYDTKVGLRHPALDFDLIAAQTDEAHRHGIDPALYYSVRWDEHAYRTQEEWRSHDADGMPLPGRPTRWRWLCLNSPYREYTYDMLEELLANYTFSRLFLDIVHYRMLCFCDHCRQAWEEHSGEPFPAVPMRSPGSRPNSRRRHGSARASPTLCAPHCAPLWGRTPLPHRCLWQSRGRNLSRRGEGTHPSQRQGHSTYP